MFYSLFIRQLLKKLDSLLSKTSPNLDILSPRHHHRSWLPAVQDNAEFGSCCFPHMLKLTPFFETVHNLAPHCPRHRRAWLPAVQDFSEIASLLSQFFFSVFLLLNVEDIFCTVCTRWYVAYTFLPVSSPSYPPTIYTIYTIKYTIIIHNIGEHSFQAALYCIYVLYCTSRELNLLNIFQYV